MPDTPDEKALLDAAVAGDTVALERLLLSYYSELERHIDWHMPDDVRHCVGADEVVLQVMAQAFRDISHFVPRFDGAFFAWLKEISNHRLTDEIRRLRRKKRGGDFHRLSVAAVDNVSSFGSLIDILCCDSKRPLKSVARREAAQALHVAIASLPDDHRHVIIAQFFWGRTVEEIAAEMGRTTGAVRGLIHRAKAELREAMGRSSRWLSSR